MTDAGGDNDLIEQLMLELGQSQSARTATELEPHFVDVDERTPEQVFPGLVQRFAKHVHFYPTGGNPAKPAADSPWPIVPAADLPSDETGQVPPHVALLRAFLQVYEKPRQIINQLTDKHLHFFDHKVLGLHPKDPVPDRALLVLSLKKNAAPAQIDPSARCTAGKDATGVELLYAPTRTTIINHAHVDSLRSVHVDASGVLRAAPIADSADGIGGSLPAGCASWPAFGAPSLPPGQVGFAIAAPVLRMAAGTRTVILTLSVAGCDLTTLDSRALQASFAVFLSGAKKWQEVSGPAIKALDAGTLQIVLSLSPQDGGVVDYDPAVHQYGFSARAPIALIKLCAEGHGLSYRALCRISLTGVAISVEVSGLSTLELQSDGGRLDPAQAFLPFGPQPTAGSQLRIGCKEALTKKLSELTLYIRWKDAPARFGDWYDGYRNQDQGPLAVGNRIFTADVRFADAIGDLGRDNVELFDSVDARTPHKLVFSRARKSPARWRPEVERRLIALDAADSQWAKSQARALRMLDPSVGAALASGSTTEDSDAGRGVLTIDLTQGFYQNEYRTQYVANLVHFTSAASRSSAPTVLNPPWTPVVRNLTLGYTAYSGDVSLSTEDGFIDSEVQFFHVAPFGVMREHGWQRQQFGLPPTVTLLPEFSAAGELYVGVGDLSPSDSVSLLFQVAEGSADPTLPEERLSWFVLGDNYWQPLSGPDIKSDTTGGLLTSGILQIAVPLSATRRNTLLPAGCIWLRATVPGNVLAVNRLVSVLANAIEVRFIDQGNDPAHHATPLPAGSITRLKTPLAAIKSVAQPYTSFGGQPRENPSHFRTRVAERLRHKDRCVSPWDYERVVLEAFPSIHRVKCLPHTSAGSWAAAGRVRLIVVPDVRNRNAQNPLAPRVDLATLRAIGEYVSARAGLQVGGMLSIGGAPPITVANPSYETLRLELKVRFNQGDFNYHRELLHRALLRKLSPWAFDGDSDIHFGGVVYKSALLAFVEQQPYVDHVTDFKMYSHAGEASESGDLFAASPSGPDSILVSAPAHTITEAP